MYLAVLSLYWLTEKTFDEKFLLLFFSRLADNLTSVITDNVCPKTDSFDQILFVESNDNCCH